MVLALWFIGLAAFSPGPCLCAGGRLIPPFAFSTHSARSREYFHVPLLRLAVWPSFSPLDIVPKSQFWHWFRPVSVQGHYFGVFFIFHCPVMCFILHLVPVILHTSIVGRHSSYKLVTSCLPPTLCASYSNAALFIHACFIVIDHFSFNRLSGTQFHLPQII